MLIKNKINNFSFFPLIECTKISIDNSTSVYITKNSLPNPKFWQTGALASSETDDSVHPLVSIEIKDDK